jgi:hypothetical protein
MWRTYLPGIFGILAIFSPGRITLAQNPSTDGNVIVSEVVEEALSANDEEIDPTIIAEDMYHFLDHPLNLNSATAEDLRQLHLLTGFQIYSLLNYIHEQGELLSVYELLLVYGFDRQVISQLLPFIILSPRVAISSDSTSQKHHFRQTILLRTGLDGNKKAGFVTDSTGTRDFQGKNRALLVRYEASLSLFTFGFTSEQDPGESFTPRGKKFCPDFNSAFIEYKGSGPVKKLILGDYKASWGQGLVMGGYGTRKGSQVLLSPQTAGLRKYSSAGENDFFRGAATSLGWRNVNLDLFVSNLKIDASLQSYTSESDSFSYFSSPDASGLHRSLSELEKKDAVVCNSFGGHAQLSTNNSTWGISYLQQQYSHLWIRNSTAYSQEIFPAGTNFRNLGSDFKVSLGKIALFGEIAADTKLHTAVFGGILAELHPLVRLSMVYRNYQPGYLGIRSSGFGESQGTKNEEGFYIGLQVYPWKNLKVDIYADNYSFPFLRYTSTNPYSGNDYLLNLSFYPKREFMVNIRFRYEKNQNRSSTSTTGVDRMEKAQKGSYRLEMNYELNEKVKLKSRFEFSYFQSGQQKTTIGFYSGHDIGLMSPSQKYKLWFRYAIYDIPEWENRIYAYENDVLYSFSVPAFNSKGTRFIIMAKTDIFQGLELSIRYALSQFQGMRTWGSGNDRVSSGDDPFLTVQLRVKM